MTDKKRTGDLPGMPEDSELGKLCFGLIDESDKIKSLKEKMNELKIRILEEMRKEKKNIFIGRRFRGAIV